MPSLQKPIATQSAACASNSDATPFVTRIFLALALVSLLILSIATISSTAHGQRVVRETAAQWKSAKVLTLTPQERWCKSIDDSGCDFKSIDEVSLLPDGGVVAISQVGVIRRFAKGGKFMGDISRPGKGPGEFTALMSAHVENDKVVWFDVAQLRIASVGLNGTPGPVVRLMPPQTMQMMYMVGESLVVFDVPPAATPGDTVVGQYRTVPASGAPRVLANIRTPALFAPGTNFRAIGKPFAPAIVADVGIGGTVAHSNGAKYLVEVSPSGGTPWRLESESPSREVTKADRDSVEVRVVKMFRAADFAALSPAVRASFDNLPRTFPPLSNIRVLRDGTIWIRPTPAKGDANVRWDVFSNDGKRIGQALLPIAALVRDGAKDWILVVERNEDDVPTVVKYKVQ